MNITTLISAKEISNRVSELGQDISNDYQGTVILISVLKGSICFMADLLRSIDSDVTIEFISISSYKGAMKGNISLHDNSIEDLLSLLELDEYISQQMATGGIAGLRHGGRPGYAEQGFVNPQTFMTEEEASTGNPGNIGSLWVKEMFVDPAEPNTAFKINIDTVKVSYEIEDPKNLFFRAF